MSAIIRLSAAILCAVPLAHAAAQPALTDPTRPPNVAAGPGLDGGQAAAAAPRLQSILISPTRKLAVIDGRTVSVGSKLDDATVVQIAETRVTLRQGTELKTIELYPGIERTPVKAGRKKGNP